MVGVTNNFEPKGTPKRGTYSICGEYHKSFLKEETVNIDCRESLPPSRYVIVQLPIKDGIVHGYLKICELQVFANNGEFSPLRFLPITINPGNIKAF